MSMVLTPQQVSDERTSRIVSTIVAVLIMILLLIPFLGFQNPPPVHAGVLVSFGEPNQGANDTRAAASSSSQEEEQEQEEEPVEEVVEETKPEPKPKPRTKPEPVAKPVKQVNTDANSRERAIRKQKEKEAKAARDKQRAIDKEKADKRAADRKKAVEKQKAQEAKRVAAAAAKRKRDAEAKALRDALAGGLSGSGSGSGNNGNPGDQGDPGGDPNGSALDGISTGSGDVGGGLSNRGILYTPPITHNSQVTGDVTIKVCVNAAGKVISSNYTLSGSTTSDQGLIRKAEEAALKYKFDKGTVEKQCGTIKVKFRVR